MSHVNNPPPGVNQPLYINPEENRADQAEPRPPLSPNENRVHNAGLGALQEAPDPQLAHEPIQLPPEVQNEYGPDAREDDVPPHNPAAWERESGQIWGSHS